MTAVEHGCDDSIYIYTNDLAVREWPRARGCSRGRPLGCAPARGRARRGRPPLHGRDGGGGEDRLRHVPVGTARAATPRRQSSPTTSTIWARWTRPAATEKIGLWGANPPLKQRLSRHGGRTARHRAADAAGGIQTNLTGPLRPAGCSRCSARRERGGRPPGRGPPADATAPPAAAPAAPVVAPFGWTDAALGQHVDTGTTEQLATYLAGMSQSQRDTAIAELQGARHFYRGGSPAPPTTPRGWRWRNARSAPTSRCRASTGHRPGPGHERPGRAGGRLGGRRAPRRSDGRDPHADRRRARRGPRRDGPGPPPHLDRALADFHSVIPGQYDAYEQRIYRALHARSTASTPGS